MKSQVTMTVEKLELEKEGCTIHFSVPNYKGYMVLKGFPPSAAREYVPGTQHTVTVEAL